MSAKGYLYFLINKPYDILSQFSDEGLNKGLGSIYSLPTDVYPVGRLDMDSEGLLILTNDRALNSRLLNPEMLHTRTYWVEVEGVPTTTQLRELEMGVEISLKKGTYKTNPCEAKIMHPAPQMDERTPPVNRKKYPITTWLEIRLTEGKNRQVRKMTAKIGHPTLRLVRVAIEDVRLGNLPSGGITQISKKVLYKKLKITD